MSGAPADRLIPGEPDEIAALSTVMSVYSELFADAARDLERIEVEWEGGAGRRFTQRFGQEPSRYRDAAKAFAEASRALGIYAW